MHKRATGYKIALWFEMPLGSDIVEICKTIHKLLPFAELDVRLEDCIDLYDPDPGDGPSYA
jgi:hypothetical protein